MTKLTAWEKSTIGLLVVAGPAKPENLSSLGAPERDPRNGILFLRSVLVYDKYAIGFFSTVSTV